jgi:hypothetical protein
MTVPLWIREKLFQKDLLQSHLKELGPNLDWARKTSIHRTSLEPRRQRLLPFTV